MLRAMLRIMKRNGVVVGIFAFLILGAAFPGMLGAHEHGAAAFVHHGHGTHAVVGQDINHDHVGGRPAAGDACVHDCCAPGCLSVIGVEGLVTAPDYVESGLVTGSQERHADGLTPLTIERPPRA